MALTGDEADPGLIERLDDLLVRLDGFRDRRGVVLGALAALLLVVGFLWWVGRPTVSQPVDDRIPLVSLETTVPSTTTASPVVVHVAGAVSRPGVYPLDGDDRVLDAIEAAGGALADADLDQLNLAAPLIDGIQIRVPIEGETLPAPNPALSPTGGTTLGPIDLNRASASELETLPGIGPSTAAAIASWRDENGPFVVVDDLLAVPGIGPAKLAAIADLVVVR